MFSVFLHLSLQSIKLSFGKKYSTTLTRWVYYLSKFLESKEGTPPAKIQKVLAGAAIKEPGTSCRKTIHTPTSVKQLLEEY